MPSSWIKVRINEESHPKSYQVRPGDLLQCYIDFAITPTSWVQDSIQSACGLFPMMRKMAMRYIHGNEDVKAKALSMLGSAS